MMDPTVIWLPKNLTLDNIRFVLGSTDFVGAFFRSLLLSLSCSVLQMFSCAVTGYGFARFRFRGRNLLFFAALLTVVVPPQIISMPLYIQYSQFTMATGIPTLNTILPTSISALFAQGLKAGLFIYLFRQSYKAVSYTHLMSISVNRRRYSPMARSWRQNPLPQEWGELT